MGEGITRLTASAAVAERLRREIQSGERAPGTRLRQAEIAARYAVSTTPVREAFQMLQAEGLVTIDPHKGAIVFQAKPDDMREAFEIRSALEQLAVALAIPNMTDRSFAELQRMVDAMSGSHDPQHWRQLNTRFHAAIYAYSERPRLCSMIANLTDATIGYSQMATLRAPRSWWADDEHQGILDACKARDVRRAQALVKKHLTLTVDYVLDMIGRDKRKTNQAPPRTRSSRQSGPRG